MVSTPDFVFDGYAIGLSGVVNNRKIPTQLICGIPQTGGFTSAESSNFSFDDVVSIGSVRAWASGRIVLNAGSWESSLEVRIESCQVLRLLSIDEIVLKLSSFHPLEGRPRFSVLGSRFRNLSVAGNSVDVKMNHGSNIDLTNGHSSSLVARIEGVPDWTKDNVIVLPETGSFSFADTLSARSSLMVTMLTVVLDSTLFKGKLTIGSGSLGGYPIVAESAVLSRQMDDPSGNDLTEVDMNDEDLEEVVTELRLWANSHPSPDEPFLFLMGRTLTPYEFLWEVEAKSRIGIVFLRCLVEQSKRWGERPRNFIARATEATGPE
jgi:hypothetical protein